MTDQEKPVDQTPSPIPAEPEVVPATGTGPADGADIVGTSLQPNPGAQPGEVAETPVVAQSAADPDPQASVDANKALAHDKIQTADDPNPEATAKGATDPAMHNPRGPVDGSGVGNENGPGTEGQLVPTRVDRGDEPTNDQVHNPNALRGVAGGPPAHHGTRVAKGYHTRPIRRDD